MSTPIRNMLDMARAGISGPGATPADLAPLPTDPQPAPSRRVQQFDWRVSISIPNVDGGSITISGNVWCAGNALDAIRLLAKRFNADPENLSHAHAEATGGERSYLTTETL